MPVLGEAKNHALVARLVEEAKALRLGPACDQQTRLGLLVTAKHRQSVLEWVDKGLAQGAQLVLDGLHRCFSATKTPCTARPAEAAAP